VTVTTQEELLRKRAELDKLLESFTPEERKEIRGALRRAIEKTVADLKNPESALTKTLVRFSEFLSNPEKRQQMLREALARAAAKKAARA